MPTCSCPDGIKNETCKHILFVMFKVLAVPVESNICASSSSARRTLLLLTARVPGYQRALLLPELTALFAAAPANPTSIIASAAVRAAYRKTEAGSASVDDPSARAGRRRRAREEDARGGGRSVPSPSSISRESAADALSRSCRLPGLLRLDARDRLDARLLPRRRRLRPASARRVPEHVEADAEESRQGRHLCVSPLRPRSSCEH